MLQFDSIIEIKVKFILLEELQTKRQVIPWKSVLPYPCYL